jgi:hypothetical protein
MAGHPQGVRPRSTRFVAHRRIAAPRASLRRFATPTTEGVIRGPRHNPANSLLVVWWAVVHQLRPAQHCSASRIPASQRSAHHRGPSDGASHPNTQPFGCLVG